MNQENTIQGSSDRVSWKGDIRALLLPLFIATVSGLLIGYDNLVIGGTLTYLTEYFSLDEWGTGFAASVAQIGGLVAALTAGKIADKIGLKKGLYLTGILFVLSSCGIFFSTTFTFYILSRLLCGFASGITHVVAPMYVSEISPAALRGRMVSMYQVGMVVGIALAIYSNNYIHSLGDEHWNETTGWRWMFLMGALPGFIFLLILIKAQESPRWLIKKGFLEKGYDIIRRINGEEEAKIVMEESKICAKTPTENSWGLFKKPHLSNLIIGSMLAIFSQTSGINVVLIYLPEIFKSTGMKAADAFSQSTIVCMVNIVFTLVALWLIDRSGRRRLILSGTAIQVFSLGLLGYLYHTQTFGILMVLALMGSIAGHAVGNGAACWVIISEVFPSQFRGLGASISITAMMVASWFSIQIFPIMQKYLGNEGTFFCFAGMALLNHIYVRLQVVETKGLVLEKIDAAMHH